MATTISPELLRHRLLDDEPVTVIDTRSADTFAEWHMPGAINVPFTPDESVELDEVIDGSVEPTDRIITICAVGKTSVAFAERLSEHGYEQVEVVQDGMLGWSRLHELAAVPTAIPAVEIFQIQRVAKGCLGYLIGAPAVGEAVVVDPSRHLEEYTRVAADDDLSITAVIDTHIHADHISGGRALADAVEAPYCLPAPVADRDVHLEYTPLAQNEVLALGDVELKAISTPGHTTEQYGILVDGQALLTADTVFVDGVGRTELQFGKGRAIDGAAELYDSIHRTILAMPDVVQILPGHFSAEKGLERTGSPIHTTVRTLRTERPLFQRTREEFIEAVTASHPEKPPNFDRMMAINTGKSTPTDEDEALSLELGPNRCAAAAD